MQPFHIHCPSCTARLRVGNAQALGQILCCPKCQSLVQVPQLPPDSLEDPQSDQLMPRQEVTGSESQEEQPRGERPTPPVAETPLTDIDNLALSTPIESGASEEDHSGWKDSLEHASLNGQQQRLPSGDWTSAGTQRARQWVLYVLAASVGIALAILTVGQILTAPSDSAPLASDARTTPPSPAAAMPTPAAETPPPTAQLAATDSAPPTPGTMEEPVVGEPAVKEPVVKEPVVKEPVVKEPVVKEPAVEELTAVDPDPRTTPLPVGLDASENPVDTPSPVGPSLQRKGATRRLDIAAQLRRALASFEIQRQPLLDFARFVSEFSYLPVTLDLASLAEHDISPLAPVSISLNQTTLQDLLTAVLTPLELITTSDPIHGIIIRHRSSGELPVEREIDVQDLVANPAEMKHVCQLVQHLIAPDSWRDQGGAGQLQGITGKLIVYQTPSIHVKIQRFCDQLRQARRPDRSLSQRVPAKHGTAQEQQRRPPLVSLIFNQPTRLLQIVKRLEQETDTRLAIDWASLALQGWYADSQSTLVANTKPLDSVLEQLLAPTPVTLNALAPTLHHVTAETPIEVVFYRTGRSLNIAQAEEQKRALIQAIGAANFSVAGGAGAICFDGPSDCLIVRLPALLQPLVKPQLRRPRDF